MHCNATLRVSLLLVLTLGLVVGPAHHTVSARSFLDCRGAEPDVNKPGFMPGAVIPYRVAASPNGTPFPSERLECVRRAFDAWTAANRTSGLDVRFVPGDGGITVRFDNATGLALRFKQAGGWTDAVRGADGYLEGALIWLSTNPKLVDTCDGITKVVLHELGHLHGLADNGRFKGPSVMNRAARKNDTGGWIPLTPTICDAHGALLASREPTVVVWRTALQGQ